MVVITLVGPMGAGKSTVAALLGERWGWPVRDLDALIVRQARCSVSQIFASEGEAGFRRREREALEAALSTTAESMLLATGGGAPVQPGAMDTILGRSVPVYLRCTPELLAQRTFGDDTRPLLAGCADVQQAIEVLRELGRSREAAYRRAAIVIDVAGEDTPQQVALKVERALKRSGHEVGP